MKAVYGNTTITCRMCGSVTVIENRTLEKIIEHKCPNCRQPMSDRELARMKLHLYLLWTQIYNEHCGPLFERFDYHINLHPHYEPDVAELEENGNREGE